MRVLCVGNLYPPAAGGGYERIWADCVAALRAAGHEVAILTTEPVPGALPPAGFVDGDDVWRTLRWYWRDYDWLTPGPRATRAIERHNASVLDAALASFAPEVVSWWGMGGMSLSLIERVRRAGLPAVGVVADGWMVYGFEADASLTRRRRGGIDLSGAAEWLFISEAVRSRTPIALARTALAHPGVDPQRFPFSPTDREWGWRLLYAGRVEPAKGVHHAVAALAGLAAEATLTIDGGGDPKYDRELERLAERAGVTGRVRRERSDPGALAAVYAAHDCVLFPVTWEEPWGLVPLEAMSVGRPVIATATGGSAEYLADLENALCVPPSDPLALAAAVQRLGDDAALRERLVERGRATAERFSAAAFEAAVVGAIERAAAA